MWNGTPGGSIVPRVTPLASCRSRRLIALALLAGLAAAPLHTAVAEEEEELAEARAMVSDGHLEEALSAYERVLEGGENAEARKEMARVLGWLGRRERALSELDRLLARAPEDLEARVTRARVLGWMGRNAAAEGELRAALALEPDDVEAHLALGDVLSWQGRYTEAARSFERARLLAPADPRPLVRLARLRLWQGDLGGARDRYKEAMRVAPEDAMAKGGLLRLGDPGKRGLRLDLAVRRDDLRGGPKDWSQVRLQLQASMVYGIEFLVAIDRYRRFGESETQWTLGVTRRLPRGWWLSGSLVVGSDVDVVARQIFQLELSRQLAARWGASLRYRRSNFPGDVHTDLASPGLEFTLLPYLRLSGRYYLTRVSGGRSSNAVSARLALFPDRRLSPYLGAAYGSEAFSSDSVHAVRSRSRVRTASAGVVWRMNEQLGLRFALDYEDIEDLYDRLGFEIGLFVGF